MSRSAQPGCPALAGIDFSFRPRSYFWPRSLETHLLTRIKGAARKAAVRDLIAAGRIDEVGAALTASGLSEADRQALGRLHPTLMGGEYLPDLGPEEVEIARITIASTTQDVTSVYARRGKGRIYYRVVDDYGGETLRDKRTRVSRVPLTLGALEIFFNRAWSLLDVLDMNFAERGYDLKRMLAFVVDINSSFYPQLRLLYTQRIEAFAAERHAESRDD